MDYFAIMPVEIFADDRLTKTDIRVLGVIMSWRNKTTNLCHPSREQISERCGLPLCKISTATTRLVELGWLKKIGNGGRSTHCVYEFIISETVTDSETVTERETVTDLAKTVTDSVTKTVTDSVTKTVTDLVRGKKLKDNLNITKTITKSCDPGLQDKPRSEKSESITSETWDSYSKSYFNRYGVEPIRNAKVSGQLSQFVARVGKAEAPHIAAFYVTHNNHFYVQKMHTVGMLLADAEKLRTEWVTNRQMTNTQAKQTDKTQARGNIFNKLIEEARANATK